ncbi:MAG: SLBB domain-containing protein [Candidatus Schekmanbacteria bacterium]|nr:SLBB domain-containing protein [Candidatus Schekmanbacteria bacterium]
MLKKSPIVYIIYIAALFASLTICIPAFSGQFQQDTIDNLYKLPADQKTAIEDKIKTKDVTTEDLDKLSSQQKETFEEMFKQKEMEGTLEISPEKKGIPANETFSPEAPITTKELSIIEKVYSEQLPTEISRQVRQFGYDFFSQPASSFAPVTDVPVGPDYVIGPDDSFTINLWGRFEAKYSVTVDRNGEISIPKIGTIKVWGMTMEGMRKFLNETFSKYYTGFEMNIVMDRIRVIKVFIVGEVGRPGTYTVSSLSTVLNSLYAAGGPTKNGSMRDIKLIRNNETFKVDLYNFLLKGDKTQDKTLQSGDTIFVPLINKTAATAGIVKRPAIYEFSDQIDLYELLNYGGGITPYSFTKRIQVERIVAHEHRIVLDINITDTGELLQNSQWNININDGDLVKIYPVFGKIENIVYLEGNVKRPGGYEFKPGMHLKDLISSYGDLLAETYFSFGRLIRLAPPDNHEEQHSFNLEKLLNGSEEDNLELSPLDRITIYSKNDMKEKFKVTIFGEVKKPGMYKYVENMKIADLVYLSGNILRKAYKTNAELVRIERSEEGIVQKSIQINLVEALNNNPEQNIPLEPDDLLFIRGIPDWDNTGMTITLGGEVKFPGTYAFLKGEKISSVIKRAGGYTDSAYLKGAFFSRKSVEEQVRSKVDELITNLEKDILQSSITGEYAESTPEQVAAKQDQLKYKEQLLGKLKLTAVTGRMVVKLMPLEQFEGSPFDFEMEPGDSLNIPKVSNSVGILGEVYTRQALLFKKGKTVSYYLSQVGGPTQNANTDEIYLVRADGTTISRLQGSSWNSEGFGWFTPGFMNIKVEPGDTVIVPQQFEKIDFLKVADTVARTIGNIALSAGIVIGAVVR